MRLVSEREAGEMLDLEPQDVRRRVPLERRELFEDLRWGTSLDNFHRVQGVLVQPGQVAVVVTHSEKDRVCEHMGPSVHMSLGDFVVPRAVDEPDSVILAQRVGRNYQRVCASDEGIACRPNYGCGCVRRHARTGQQGCLQFRRGREGPGGAVAACDGECGQGREQGERFLPHGSSGGGGGASPSAPADGSIQALTS